MASVNDNIGFSIESYKLILLTHEACLGTTRSVRVALLVFDHIWVLSLRPRSIKQVAIDFIVQLTGRVVSSLSNL